MRDPNQKIRFTDSDLTLMKALFAGNDELFYAIRTVMFQLPLTERQVDILKESMNDEVSALLHKVFIAGLDPDSPLFQMTHLALSLGAEIKGLSPEGAWPFIKAKKIEGDFMLQQLDALKNPGKKPKIVLEDLIKLDYPESKMEEAFVNITAWNFLLNFIDSQLQQTKYLAGRTEETIEQTKERMKRDSSQ